MSEKGWKAGKALQSREGTWRAEISLKGVAAGGRHIRERVAGISEKGWQAGITEQGWKAYNSLKGLLEETKLEEGCDAGIKKQEM